MKKKQSKNRIGPLLAIVGMLPFVFACKASVSEPTSPDELAALGYIYEITRYDEETPAHNGALLAVIKTGIAPNRYGLLFLQPNSNGEGMVCPNAQRLSKGGTPDASLRCVQQTPVGTVETLTVGTVGSEYCAEIRDEAENAGSQTPDGENPILTNEECEEDDADAVCICFRIEQVNITSLDGAPSPPDPGWGSGGKR